MNRNILKKSSVRCRRKTGVPGEKPAEASLDWKPNGHTAPGPGIEPGSVDFIECSSYFISHASKIFLKIINNRMSSTPSSWQKSRPVSEQGEEQGPNRQHKNIIEKCKAHFTPLYLCFIDYRKAFDCACHQDLWKIMREWISLLCV